MVGLRFAAGELLGASVESEVAVPAELGTGNANVGDGETDPVGDTPGEGDASVPGDTVGLDTGLGVGEGGMIFSQWCNGTLAPPISLTSVSQRA